MWCWRAPLASNAKLESWLIAGAAARFDRFSPTCDGRVAKRLFLSLRWYLFHTRRISPAFCPLLNLLLASKPRHVKPAKSEENITLVINTLGRVGALNAG